MRFAMLSSGSDASSRAATRTAMSANEIDAVLDLGARAGTVMLANGAAASEAVGAVLRMGQAAGVSDLSAVVSYDHITLTAHVEGQPPRTRLMGIRMRDVNLGRYNDALVLTNRVAGGELTVDEGRARIRSIARGSAYYPRWLTWSAAGMAGACAALVFGGNLLVMLAAGLAQLVVDAMFGTLLRRGAPLFFLQVATGLIGVGVAACVRVVDPTVDPTLVVVAVIIVQLAGMTSTGAVQDAITGWHMSAVGRFFEALMKTVGLVLGVKLGLSALSGLGRSLPMSQDIALGAVNVVVMLVAAGFISLGFNLAVHSPPHTLLPAAVLTSGGYALYDLGLHHGLDQATASGLAAIAVGVVATVLARVLHAPTAVFALGALIPLLPGLILYQGLMASGDSGRGAFESVSHAVSIALALAVGMSFGQYAGTLLLGPLRLAERMFVPLFQGPFASARARRGLTSVSVGEGRGASSSDLSGSEQDEVALDDHGEFGTAV